MELKYTRDGQTYSVESDSLPPASIAYLLQYGFSQSLQDSIAGRAKAVRDEMEEAALKARETLDEDEIALAISADLEGTLGKRRDAIAQGTVGVRIAGPRDEVSSLAKEQVLAALKKRNVKADKEKLAELVASHVEKNRPALVAELERRKAAVSEIEIELA